jgi:WD40 repeat protein
MRAAILCLLVSATAVHAEDLPAGAVLRLGSSALRHNALISNVAWSPDGKRIASVGWDQHIKVWESSTGRQIVSLPACWRLRTGWSKPPYARRAAA